MGTRDKRLDAYIAKSADFAQPILTQVRETVHAACPDVEETLKWSMPAFMYRGGILCQMAAFKEHATFGFWKGALVTEVSSDKTAAGQFGRLTSVKDLPSKKDMTRFIKRAMELSENGTPTKRPLESTPKKVPKKMPPMPDYFMAAIRKNKKALATYEGFSPSMQREYIEWVTDAKGEDTRARRIAQAVEWMAEGKSRNWKYQAR